MEHRFYINSQNGYAGMISQYEKVYTQFASIRSSANHQSPNEIIYDIAPDYGEGCIKVYKLMENVILVILDVVFHHDVITEFELSQEYFEIEYCVDGCLSIREDTVGDMCLFPNDLSISMSRETRGSVKRCAGQKYQGVSITAEKAAIASYFGSCGIELWEETIERLKHELREQYYQGINAPPEIATAFLQIFHDRLPRKSKILFFESKTMEILSNIVSYDSSGTLIEAASLDEFESYQIKKIPKILMGNLHGLPTVRILSKELGINKNKLAKGFKKIYGDTIFSYHRKMCLQHSISLLLDTKKSINEIALDVGYSNPSNFCYAFKKQYGITPLQYRTSSVQLVN